MIDQPKPLSLEETQLLLDRVFLDDQDPLHPDRVHIDREVRESFDDWWTHVGRPSLQEFEEVGSELDLEEFASQVFRAGVLIERAAIDAVPTCEQCAGAGRYVHNGRILACSCGVRD